MARTISVPASRAIPRAPKRLLALRSDEFLLAQIRAGSEAAFEVLYERHVQGILSFCRHMLRSREEAEDAVQHTFAAAHRDLLRDEREIRIKPWLYAIARNRCLSLLRSRKEQPDEALDGQTAGLDDEVERRAELRELVRDLHDLPADQRAALVLSELRDLSHAEVAEALGLEAQNVKGLVFRARSGLIERREARSASCEEIQQELASARGGSLRKGRLRHHMRSCSACSDYLDQVRAQRKMLALVLPVVPSLGLKKAVLAAVGIGGGAGGGGGAAAAGGGILAAALPAGGATVAKVAVVGALLGGAGVAGEAATDGDGPASGAPKSAVGERSADARPTPRGVADPLPASDRPGAVRERLARADKDKRQKEKRRKARRRGRAHAKGPKLTPAVAAPRRVGHAKPEKVKAVERQTRATPKPLRPRQQVHVPAAPPVDLKPVREPKERALAEEPTPTVPTVPAEPRRRARPAP